VLGPQDNRLVKVLHFDNSYTTQLLLRQEKVKTSGLRSLPSSVVGIGFSTT
jgi:hypothetical protein